MAPPTKSHTMAGRQDGLAFDKGLSQGGVKGGCARRARGADCLEVRRHQAAGHLQLGGPSKEEKRACRIRSQLRCLEKQGIDLVQRELPSARPLVASASARELASPTPPSAVPTRQGACEVCAQQRVHLRDMEEAELRIKKMQTSG